MAEDTTTVSEDDIADVNLLETDIASSTSGQASDTADQAKDDGADTKADAGKVDDTKSDAKATEAKDQQGTESKDGAKSDDKAAGDQKSQGDQGDQKADDKTQQDQKTPEEERAEQRARAQQEWQNRQRTRNEVAQQVDQFYGPKTQDQLEAEGLDPADAKVEALRQEFAYNQERTRVAELNAGMQAEAVNAINDFPIFNPNSPEFDEDFTKEVEAQYKTAARLQVDDHGIITNAEVPLYDFYQRAANIYSRGASKGAEQGQLDAAQMMSRTENPGGSSSTGKGDSLEELEERLGNVVIT